MQVPGDHLMRVWVSEQVSFMAFCLSVGRFQGSCYEGLGLRVYRLRVYEGQAVLQPLQRHNATSVARSGLISRFSNQVDLPGCSQGLGLSGMTMLASRLADWIR